MYHIIVVVYVQNLKNTNEPVDLSKNRCKNYLKLALLNQITTAKASYAACDAGCIAIKK